MLKILGQRFLNFNTLCTKTNTKFDGGSLWDMVLQQVFNGRNPSGYESLEYEKTYSQDLLSLSNISYSEPGQNFNYMILKREE